MLYTLPVTLSMSVAGASSKNFTIGAGKPRTPCTRPTGCLHTRSCLLTPHQQHQLLDLFASREHVALEVTWSAYQNIIDAYRAPDTSAGKAMMEAEINTPTSTRVPRGMTELITLSRTLTRRNGDILCLHQTTPTPQAALPKPSTHPSKPVATTPGLAKPHPLHHPSTPSKPADSKPNHNPNYEEPVMRPRIAGNLRHTTRLARQ